MRRTISTFLLGLAGSLVLAAGALADNGGLTPQSSSSPNAAGIERSYLLVAVVTVSVMTVLNVNICAAANV